jgi:hypothetical protein
MELAKKENNQTALGKISQDGIALALTAKRFDQAASLMPAKIEKVFEQPKVFELLQATDEKNVSGFIEFELINLAERINCSGNLTSGQVKFIASQLIGMYPKESLADFKICFEKGSMGMYGKIFKLDGIEIKQWMDQYLDEKYKVLEDQLMKEKETMYAPIPQTLTEEIKDQQTKQRLAAWLDEIQKIEGKAVLPMTEKEIRSEGQERPKKEVYQNGYTLEYVQLKDKIQRTASEFYRDQLSFSGFKIYPVNEFDVFAASEKDAIEIYTLAVSPN